jgi:hypothetical protein
MKKRNCFFSMMFSLLFYQSAFIKLHAQVQQPELGRMKEDVRVLTHTEKPRNYQNKSSLRETTDYIKKVFNENSDQVTVHTFETAEGNTYENITASFGPEDGERVLIGAHYDVYGPFPGADDNASGVAAILEMSRLLQKEDKELKHRIDLVAFALEEPPFFATPDMGSAHYAELMSKQNVKIKLMVALDMIGYYSSSPDSQKRPFPLQALYPSTGDFISLVGNLGQRQETKRVKKLMLEADPTLKVETVNAPAQIPGIDFSDHKNFWKHNYPAIMMTDTAFYRNPNYHSATDTIETLDFHTMTKVVHGLYYAAIHY